MHTTYINPPDVENEYKYERKYPLYGTTRLRKSTLERLKRYGRYGDSIDEIVVMLLDRLEGKEIPEEEKSW
jgi:hypothetical protein